MEPSFTEYGDTQSKSIFQHEVLSLPFSCEPVKDSSCLHDLLDSSERSKHKSDDHWLLCKGLE